MNIESVISKLYKEHCENCLLGGIMSYREEMSNKMDKEDYKKNITTIYTNMVMNMFQDKMCNEDHCSEFDNIQKQFPETNGETILHITRNHIQDIIHNYIDNYYETIMNHKNK